MSDLIYPDESYAIIGACFQVYKEIGAGFLEAVYQECLAIEFDYQNIPYTSQQEIHLTYRGKTLQKTYIPDFVCYRKIIIEIKAISHLRNEN